MNRNNAPPNNNELIVVEGIVHELQVALGKQNLLLQLDNHYKGKSAISGAGAIAGNMYGQVANAAMLAMYDGEDTENFLCQIDGHVMCGTFGGASKLPEGHRVKAIVQKQGDVLIAKGILSESTGLVWLNHAWGWKAERAVNFKIAWWCFGFAMLGITLSIIFLGVNPADSKLETWLWGGMSAMVLCFGMAFWNSSTMNSLADPATEVFRMLGFAEPEKVNLNSYRYGIVHGHDLLHTDEINANHINVYCYKKAIEDGKLKMTSEPSA